MKPPSEQAETLVENYLKANIASTKSATDLAHIVYTVVFGLDGIVSWNMKHIVRLKTRHEVNGLNKLLGYREIDMVTPEEVLGYDT